MIVPAVAAPAGRSGAAGPAPACHHVACSWGMSAWRRAAVPARLRARASITTSSTATGETGPRPSGPPPVCRSSLVPRRPGVAVPAAGLAGAVLPGCECSSVPVAARLVDKGVPQAAALAFLLSAPAINPVVMVSTAVAFPGRPELVAARFAASLLAAVAVGIVWSRLASPAWLQRRLAAHAGHSHGRTFVDTAMSDLLQAGGFLVLGAALVATLHTVVPRTAFDAFAGNGLVSIVVLAALAVVLSICSEADAFVAAGLTQFSLTSRLVFLVVGPMLDIKLIALHAGTFGGRFALRFDPLVLGAAVAAASVVGGVAL